MLANLEPEAHTELVPFECVAEQQWPRQPADWLPDPTDTSTILLTLILILLLILTLILVLILILILIL